MTIPDLPPELTFEILGASQEDCDFAFKAKRRAMGPHVEKMWGWDESYQRVVHERHYAEKPFYAIKMSSENIGTLSFQVLSQYVRFGEFYIFPEYQGQGIGSKVLSHFLALADRMGLPTRLEYLHWSPVGSLYRRYGFQDIGRSDIHVFLERKPVLS